MSQRVVRPQRSYLGKGKLEELADLADRHQASVVMLNDELTPAQQRIVEDAVQVKVIDRTALILDIFAGRALTKEGRLQVELAQHEYLLPRLAGQWSHLERLGGGIGTRGPGETQIETDRRLIRRRIQRLKAQLEEVRTHRALYRQRRKKQGIPVVSLIGYTNAGKSTLFNVVSKADSVVQDRLFATLDPVTRRARLPSGKPFLLTDTVGFIHKLPAAVVAAFRATLEELGDADLLLHVVDATHPNALEQVRVVEKTLDGMGLGARATVVALNKVDLLAPRHADGDDLEAALAPVRDRLCGPEQPTALVSADRGWGIDTLLSLVEASLERTAAPAVG